MKVPLGKQKAVLSDLTGLKMIQIKSLEKNKMIKVVTRIKLVRVQVNLNDH